MKTEIRLIGTSSDNREEIKEEFKKIQEVVGENHSHFNIQTKCKTLRKDFPSLIQNAKAEIIHISAEGKKDDGT
ncbi:hypothetical protein IQ277_35940, partial [Nostocales cyanobacterium LEGE 12452]|nr:hypothetical protein [Nostocales cyanobacterium LEGE 12452]